MTRTRIMAAALVAIVVASAPMTPALAWRHHHGGPFFLPFAIGAAVVGTAAAIATAPFVAVAGPPAPYPGYAPPAYAYAPPPYAYGPPPGYSYAPYGYGPPPR